MAKERHLSKAPITEAIVDIRVKLSADEQPKPLLYVFTEGLQNQFPGRFTEKKEIVEGAFSFKAGPPFKQESTTSWTGYRYDSQDGRHVIQAKLDGYTFSWLKPYEDWQSLRREAYLAWKIYRDALTPEAITRVTTRFINQIELPGEGIDFDEYLTAAPPIPKELPQAYAGFLSRLAIPFDGGRVMVSLTQSFQSHINPAVVPVIIDVEVTCAKLLESQRDGWDRMAWETLDGLRTIKNKVFFESLTEKTAGILE